MVIEFLGLPGSGKSYIANELYDELIEKSNILNIEVLNISKIHDRLFTRGLFAKAYYIVNSFIYCPSLFVYIYYILVSSLSFDEFSKRTSYLLKTFAYLSYISKNKNQNSVFILDEGYVHRAFTIFFGMKNYKHIGLLSKYLKKKKASLLIRVTSDLDTIVHRLNRRGWPPRMRSSALDDKDKLNLLVLMKSIEETIVESVDSCISIYNTTEEIDISQIMNEINELVSNH